MKRKKKAKGKATRTELTVPAQPIIRSSLKRFVYATERSDMGVTGHTGLPLAIEAFHSLGLYEACQLLTPLRNRVNLPVAAGSDRGHWSRP